MAYGFEAKNDDGKVIINDTIENLHFIGKATRGGADSNYGDIPGYSGSNDTLDGRVVHTYTITCSGTPVAFIKPDDYARWHAVIKQSVSSTTWTFQVMISGTSTSNPPELYCFVNADDIPVPSGETHGMIVFKADGTSKTFDSRRQPLAITGGGTAVAPSDPTNTAGIPGTTSGHAWNYATNDHDFRSSSQYTAVTDSAADTSTAMFSCPSLAQAVYKRQMHGYKESCGCCGFGCQDHYSTASWWVMYRSAFRLRSGNFDAGWTNYAAGFAFSSNYESGGWFGGGGGSYSTGTMPYTAKTINLQSNAFIIADSSRYD
jgi:hypothetical protein